MAMQSSDARVSHIAPDAQLSRFEAVAAMQRRPAANTTYAASTAPAATYERYGPPSRDYLDSARKRALDTVGAVTLLVLLLPLLLMVAALIRATSKGPVLFTQWRCGAGGRPFLIYKFRSMYLAEDTPPTVQQVTRSDARVTPIGRFIRRTSVDELPQLVNVLQGHMSLIGPRPHATCHDTYYGERIPRYGERFAARPGLSGLAQVSGARGGTPLISDMERRIELDLTYIHSASLATDIRILGATAREMMFSKAAY